MLVLDNEGAYASSSRLLMLTPAQITRLEKTARDNGFEIVLPPTENWRAFASSQTTLSLWLTIDTDKRFYAAFTHANIASELAQFAPSEHPPLPIDAREVLMAPDVPALDKLLFRVFQLSKTLPDELLHDFEKKTANLPQNTEVERLVVQRVGQEIFRAGLRKYWQDRCAITGLAIVELLRASHIKPWAHCEKNAERLDVYNGLLLAPHYDAAFDKGFLTVQDDGELVYSPHLSESARNALGMTGSFYIVGLHPKHAKYLDWHRTKVFRK